jgi:PAS domain S-box-containing protein
MRRTVLMIDDKAADFARYQAALVDCEAVDYTLANSPSADEGLALIEDMRPDCVLLAYSLGKNGGISILQRIRAKHHTLPVIMLTSSEVELSELEVMKAEGAYSLPKISLTGDTLHAAIELAIGSPGADSAIDIALAAPSHTVLIIDDNPDDREAFKRALKKADESCGYLEAGDALSGIAMVEQQRPDCVLLDYSLPGLNGLDALQRIHEMNAFLPVIMLTGQGSEAIAVQAIREGAHNYLVKATITPNLLHGAILSAIRHAALEREISEQRLEIHRQKLALAETARLKSAILASAGAMIVATDCDGNILTFNPAAEIALGYSAAEVIFYHTPILWCDKAEIATRAAELAISDGAKLKCGFEVLSYIPQALGQESREWTFIRKDGSRFPASTSITPLRQSEGQVTGFLCMAEDITQRRQHELALKTSEETFRAAVENAPNGMALIDLEGNFLTVNPALCALLGLKADELKQRPIRSLPHPEDADLDRDKLKQLYRGKIGSYRVEMRLVHKSGRIVHALISMSLTRYADGAAKYYVAQVLDITDRKEMDHIKNEFISIVSHELRTPLTSIRGSLGLLTGKIAAGLPPTVQMLVDIANKNCERLILLINDILDIDKMASGTMRFDKRRESLGALLTEAVEGIRDYAGSIDVRLNLALPAEVLVSVDRDRLLQVLNNLLSNAVKFSPRGGTVELAVETRGGNIRISVRDHGPGIPEEFQDRLFNKFFQVDSSSTREKSGTGLGLHISKQIVEHMGGEIGYSSEPGQGTTVWIEFPALTAEAAAGPDKPALPELGRRVLICEDDDRVAWLIQKMLTKEGFAADVAHSIPEARRQLKSGGYAAMTLDLTLPSGNGIEFARELHDDPETSRLPIVVVTGTERAGWLELEEASGIVAWIVKPIDSQLLVASVKKASTAHKAAA